jgi:hypothetical protein
MNTEFRADDFRYELGDFLLAVVAIAIPLVALPLFLV